MRMLRSVVLAVALVAGGFALGFLVGGWGDSTSTGTSLATKPPSDAAAALALRDELARAVALVPILDSLGPDTLEPVVAAFESAFPYGGPGPGPALDLLFEAWARFDPQGASERIQRWPLDAKRHALPALLRPWARRDPEAALKAYREIVDPTILKVAHPALILGWAESGDPAVWEYLATLDTGNLASAEAAVVVMHTFVQREGVGALLRQVETLPDDGMDAERFKLFAFRSAASVVARIDASKAVAFAERHRGTRLGDGVIRRVAVHWVTQDGPAAMSWLRSQPVDQERDGALREAYRRWLRRDREAAIAWMRGTDQKHGLEPILDMYATALAQDDPLAAIAWADGIADPEIRKDALTKVGRVWMNKDRDAARGWLEERGLYAEVWAKFQKNQNFPSKRGPASRGVRIPADDFGAVPD